MTRRKLPIGMQTFRTVREDHCYYVDKTACIRRLLDEGAHYFLSRPRRFGKYRDRGEPIHRIAVEFSRDARNLAAFDVQQA